MSEHVALVRQFIECYDEGRLDAAGALLAPDLLAAITEGDGTATIVRGRDGYLARSPDLRAAGGSARLTQVVDVDADRTLAMVEIRAERDGRTLHNFAGFLVVVRDDLISELWMVDAKPAESEAFWR